MHKKYSLFALLFLFNFLQSTSESQSETQHVRWLHSIRRQFIQVTKNRPTILEGFDCDVTSFGFNQQGTKIGAVSDEKVQVWKIDADGNVDPKVFESKKFYPSKTRYFGLSKDGKTVHVYSIHNGEIDNDHPMVLEGFKTRIQSNHYTRKAMIAVNPQGTMVAVLGSDEKVYVYAIHDGKLDKDHPLVLVDKAHYNIEFKFNPQGTMIAVSASWAKVHVYTIHDGKIDKDHPILLEGFKTWIQSMSFNPQGTMIAAASSYGKVRVYPIVDGKIDTNNPILLGENEGHPRVGGKEHRPIETVSFNSQGTMIVVSSSLDNSKVEIYTIDDEKIDTDPILLGGFNREFMSVSYNSPAQMVADSSDTTLRVWNTAQYTDSQKNYLKNINDGSHYVRNIQNGAPQENVDHVSQQKNIDELSENEQLQTFDESLRDSLNEQIQRIKGHSWNIPWIRVTAAKE